MLRDAPKVQAEGVDWILEFRIWDWGLGLEVEDRRVRVRGC